MNANDTKRTAPAQRATNDAATARAMATTAAKANTATSARTAAAATTAVAPGRRDVIKGGGTIVVGGLLAGCLGDGDSDGADDASANGTDAGDSDDAEQSYTVEIQPAGEVTFSETPSTWVAENASWADMGVALGMDAPSAVVLTAEYRTWHYEDVPGVSVDTDEITSLWQDGISKELLYDIGADVHFIDPNYMVNLIPEWDRSDVEEIADGVAPFCGNTSFSTYPWHESYPYFGLYEATEKVAQVFQRTERFEALSAFHDEVIGGIRERLPAESERPEIALLSPESAEPTTFYPYRLGDTTAYKHWHDLGVGDALDGSNIQSFTSNRGSIDYEPLLEIDPEVICLYTDQYQPLEEFRDTYLAFLRDHDAASQLTAVQSGEVYPAGAMYQGPILHLANTERAARQLYSEEFGQSEQLYDRERLGAIVNGEE